MLGSPDHAQVLALLRQLVEASLDDTMASLLFPAQPLADHEKAVLEAEARVLMGLRKDFADAFRAGQGAATPGPDARETSPAGFV